MSTQERVRLDPIKPGDPIRAPWLNAIRDRALAAENRNLGSGGAMMEPGGTYTRRRLSSREVTLSWVGKIVTEGPGEPPAADFDNAFYWVQKYQPVADFGAVTDPALVMEAAPDAPVRVLHPFELGLGAGGSGVHLLLKRPPHIDTADYEGVEWDPWVTVFEDSVGFRWMEPWPGLRYTDVDYAAACVDDEGCPSGDYRYIVGAPHYNETPPSECTT